MDKRMLRGRSPRDLDLMHCGSGDVRLGLLKSRAPRYLPRGADGVWRFAKQASVRTTPRRLIACWQRDGVPPTEANGYSLNPYFARKNGAQADSSHNF